ncbi:MAG: 30S ribosomal protein S5 [Spirochaetia bacterium]|nr:30S ribosomal protein S5 [Spirochaetia bacterium]
MDTVEIELTERVVNMARVAKVVKGGRRFSFNALTVVGDSDSYVGLGFGKAREVPEAIRKSIEHAKKGLTKIKRQGSTIPHEVTGKFKSARVLLKPCAPGTGIIAGEAVKAVVELAGIQDILTKSLGSSNKLNIVKATLDGLNQLETIEEAKERRSVSLKKMFGEYSSRRRQEKRKDLGIVSKNATETPVTE